MSALQVAMSKYSSMYEKLRHIRKLVPSQTTTSAIVDVTEQLARLDTMGEDDSLSAPESNLSAARTLSQEDEFVTARSTLSREERFNIARSILQSVNAKLRGRETKGNGSLSVPEQVSLCLVSIHGLNSCRFLTLSNRPPILHCFVGCTKDGWLGFDLRIFVRP